MKQKLSQLDSYIAHNFKVKRALLLLLLTIVGLALSASAAAGVTFSRYQQLCGYQAQVEAGRLTSSNTDLNLCPNILDPREWKFLITNLSSNSVIDDLYATQTTSFDIGSEDCDDQLSPLCWLKNSNSKLKQTKGFTNFLIIGVDSRATGAGSWLKNTDTIIMISLDHASGKLMFLSFPRDLYLDYKRPNGVATTYKINAVYAIDGIPGIKGVVEQTTGKKIHYYAVVDLKLVEDVIDALGGVTINVPRTFKELYPCKEVPKGRSCPNKHYSIDGYFGEFTFKKGVQKMDSFTALVYARARKYTSDFDRARRQQDIIRAVLKQAVSSDKPLGERVGLYLDMYKQFQRRVKTNIKLEDVAAMLSLMDKLDAQSAQLVMDWSFGGGGYFKTLGILPGVGWSLGFVDRSHTQFKSYINKVMNNLPYYIEKPKILVINATGESIPSSAQVRKITKNNPYAKMKIVKSDEVQLGTKIYDLSNGKHKGSLRDIQTKLSDSLIFNPQLDGITQSGYKEDILIILGANPIPQESDQTDPQQ